MHQRGTRLIPKPGPWGVSDTLISNTDNERSNTIEEHFELTVEHSKLSSTENTEICNSKSHNSLSIPLKIILIGGPASGKGTQCKYIAAKYNVIHLSTGDMLRDAIQRGDSIGKIAQEFMDAGQLVPDDIVIQLLLHRISQPDCVEHGWLLDGFPRTRAQADALIQHQIEADLVISLNVPDEELMTRVTGRRTDPITGKIYHMKYQVPPSDIVHRLIQRSDDTQETMKHRLGQFHTNLASIKQQYDHNMVEVDGSSKPDDVAVRISQVIEKRVLMLQRT